MPRLHSRALFQPGKARAESVSETCRPELKSRTARHSVCLGVRRNAYKLLTPRSRPARCLGRQIFALRARLSNPCGRLSMERPRSCPPRRHSEMPPTDFAGTSKALSSPGYLKLATPLFSSNSTKFCAQSLVFVSASPRMFSSSGRPYFSRAMECLVSRRRYGTMARNMSVLHPTRRSSEPTHDTGPRQPRRQDPRLEVRRPPPYGACSTEAALVNQANARLPRPRTHIWKISMNLPSEGILSKSNFRGLGGHEITAG